MAAEDRTWVCRMPLLYACVSVTYLIFTSVNANLDLIVSATSLLRSLNETPGMGVDHSVLDTTKELQEQVSYSMQECAGTERYFSNKSLFDHIVQMAQTIPHTVSMNSPRFMSVFKSG